MDDIKEPITVSVDPKGNVIVNNINIPKNSNLFLDLSKWDLQKKFGVITISQPAN